MFSLFKGIWDYLFRKEDYYVLILGLDNAGKTVSICIITCPVQTRTQCTVQYMNGNRLIIMIYTITTRHSLRQLRNCILITIMV